MRPRRHPKIYSIFLHVFAARQVRERGHRLLQLLRGTSESMFDRVLVSRFFDEIAERISR